MEETYTITVIEDAAVPLAAVPGRGIPVGYALFIIALLCVMAGCAVFYLHRYLQECRALRLRLAELTDSPVVITPSYEARAMEPVDGRYNRRILSETVRELEEEKVRRASDWMKSD